MEYWIRKSSCVVICLLLCVACQKEDASKKVATDYLVFDEVKWNIKEGWDYPYRDSMLQDLITDSLFRVYKRDKVLQLLGEPTKTDSNYVFYRVKQTRFNLFPLHTKTLVILFTEDSTIQWMKIHE
jgi:hypothetical protein